MAKEGMGAWQRTLSKQGGILEAKFWRALGGSEVVLAEGLCCGLYGEMLAAVNRRIIQEEQTFLVMS